MIRIKSIKRKNPTDHELLKQIIIEPEDLGSQIIYKVFYENKLIGYAKLNPSNRTPFNTITIDIVEIDSKFRRKGINTYLYDFIESDTGLKIIQSEPRYLSSDGEKSPYRRKGLASFMYNTIEKDQKVSLQPSQDLLPDGRRFWENRLKNKPEKMGLLYR